MKQYFFKGKSGIAKEILQSQILNYDVYEFNLQIVSYIS